MEGFRSSYFFTPSGIFLIRMVRYYFPLFAINLLSVKIFLKLHMSIAQDFSTTLPCLFIITHKVSLCFFNLVLEFLQLFVICTYSFYI